MFSLMKMSRECVVSWLNRVMYKRRPYNSALVCRDLKFTCWWWTVAVHAPATTCESSCTRTFDCFIFLTLTLQYFLSISYVQSSLHEVTVGSSMGRPLCLGCLYIHLKYCLFDLSLIPILVCTLVITGVLHGSTSPRQMFCLSILLHVLFYLWLSSPSSSLRRLALLSRTAAVNFHTSDPHVRILYTHTLYRLRFMCRLSSFHRCLSLPKRCDTVLIILAFMSACSSDAFATVVRRETCRHVLHGGVYER